MSDAIDGGLLLKVARNAIAQHFDQSGETFPDEKWLHAPGATFVTLTQHGQLRGCIGTLEAHRPLGEDVRQNAIAAAFHDKRFEPLKESELAHTRVEISLLSPQQPLTFDSEADALAKLRPGVDGVVLVYRHQRSTFLPQVWEQLPHPQQFMAHLKRKAGLADNFWSPEVKLFRYTVDKWKESEPVPAGNE